MIYGTAHRVRVYIGLGLRPNFRWCIHSIAYPLKFVRGSARARATFQALRCTAFGLVRVGVRMRAMFYVHALAR